MLNVKMNLGNNAGVGENNAGRTNSSAASTGKVNKDFKFNTGLRSVSETFFVGGGLCLQDVWAPNWEGRSDMGKVDQLEEGMNATLHLEVAESGAFGAQEVVRRGFMVCLHVGDPALIIY